MAKEKKMNAFDQLKQVKTLLVDDDEFIRNSLELAFKTKGCCLHVAETAEEGLQAIKEQQFDIIISDLRLPGINGLDFLKLTTVTHPDAIRFLITAYRDDHLLSKAIRSGIDQFYADRGVYPARLDDLVDKKYLRSVPLDPITESKTSWIIVPPSDPALSGVYDVKSGAAGEARDGSRYADW